MQESPVETETALVVDELALVRAGVVAVLHDRGYRDVVETRAARDAAGLLATDPVDLVVCGVPADLPVVDAARRFVKLRPRPPIVMLLPPAHEHALRYLVAMGVDAVGLRNAETTEITAALDAARKGAPYVAPALHPALRADAPLRPLAEHDDEVLSAREREVLTLLAQGRSNREIAVAMSVTLATVKSHLVRIYAKLEASNRNECVGRAVSLGLLG